MMRGITFNNLPPISPADPVRMDVVCFIGFAPQVPSPFFSDTLKRWLVDYGWDKDKIDCLSHKPEFIENTPIPLESWDAFCAVFADIRLDRIGRIQSLDLKNPLSVMEKDRVFYVIIDGHEIPVDLDPDAHGDYCLENIVSQINVKIKPDGATASIDPLTKSNLIIERNDRVVKGEITVYRNESLGFPQAVQSDSFYVKNYSAAAVKAFFQLGGKKCYFISMGDPCPYYSTDEKRDRQLFKLLWGREKTEDFFKDRPSFTRKDYLTVSFPSIPNGVCPVSEWNGLSHLAGLSDVTYLCFPDLIDVLGKTQDAEPKELTSQDAEIFAVCTEPLNAGNWSFTVLERAPLFDEEAYKVWKRAIEHILAYLSSYARTVQLVAGLPMPENSLRKDFSRFVSAELLLETENDENQFRHLQLVFPWLKTERSDMLPESLEPPEGIFLGLLAGKSRQIGAFRSIAGSFVNGAYDLSPQDIDAYTTSEQTGLSFADRISWLDFVPDGIAIHSDVTAVLKGNYRYGAVRRIMILVWRAAHRIGLDYVFEPSSEKIWRTVRNSLTELLHHIYLKNGLRGKSSKEAYSVSCGRSTMTQNDIDNGRLIANVILQPAVPIERIAVDILLESDGSVFIGK